MERQEGYYWINYLKEFRIAYWSEFNCKWNLSGSINTYDDSDFEHINEVRIKYPGELPD